MMFDRARPATHCQNPGPGPVLHWMRREFRVQWNPGLLLARNLARNSDQPLAVVICLPSSPDRPSTRQREFLVQGLPELEHQLRALGIPLALLHGDPVRELASLVRSVRVGAVTTDFDSLRPGRTDLAALAQELDALSVPVWEVDGRNIVPCWLTSDKKEYMARTIRPKIHRRLQEFMDDLPAPAPLERPWDPAQHGALPEADHNMARAWARQGFSIPAAIWPVAQDQAGPQGRATPWPAGGESAGEKRLRRFVQRELPGYATRRNDPVQDASSRLSPWLHHGFVSALHLALEAARSAAPQEDKDDFLEELIVRRELSDNFCFYEPEYDSLGAGADWARATLDKHRQDPRYALYTLEEFEAAQTHQPLWNAAQLQLRTQGVIHGYMRMYWAKKMLEWSASPEEALHIAITLNDRWGLDGMDANGYTGVAWSICGVHDRGWKERPVYGNIRYMNANGARRKFDAAEYVRRHAGVEQARLFAAMKK
jgi:deoxyribodipyrimidine photo-lyase